MAYIAFQIDIFEIGLLLLVIVSLVVLVRWVAGQGEVLAIQLDLLRRLTRTGVGLIVACVVVRTEDRQRGVFVDRQHELGGLVLGHAARIG